MTNAARRDIHEIVEFLAAANPQTAQRFLEDLFAAFSLLAERPEIGHRRSDLTTKRVRFLTVARWYLVVHRNAAPVQIVRVVDGRRDIRRVLG